MREHVTSDDAGEYQPGVNVTVFRLPATWEDMEHLGLDPLTGEQVEQ